MADEAKKKSRAGLIVLIVILLIIAAVVALWISNRKFLNKTPLQQVSGSQLPGGGAGPGRAPTGGGAAPGGQSLG